MTEQFEASREIGAYLERGVTPLERLRMSKKRVTRLFLGAIAAFGAGLVLGFAALSAALASDAIDVGGNHYVDVNGGSGAWTSPPRLE